MLFLFWFSLRILYAPHADPVGDDVYNKQLSSRRVTAIYGLLTRDAGLWESIYNQEQWGTRAIQTMLATVQRPKSEPATVPSGVVQTADGEAGSPTNDAYPYYTASIDGLAGSNTTAAVKDFQSDHGLAKDGFVGVNTRRELFPGLHGHDLP